MKTDEKPIVEAPVKPKPGRVEKAGRVVRHGWVKLLLVCGVDPWA
jgi:hypothetical protein